MTKYQNAGGRRSLVEFQSLSGTANAYNEIIPEDEVWTPYATRWAMIEPLQGRELIEAQQVKAEVSHKITILAGLTVSSKDRIRFGNRIFDIGPAVNVGEANRELQIMAIERV
jgi:SPP1 family predicted phage head-tail adaptor